jgi:serine O-acetyltransferase
VVNLEPRIIDDDVPEAERERVAAFAVELTNSRAAHGPSLPVKPRVATFADDVLGLLFPQLSERHETTTVEIGHRIDLISHDLCELSHGLVEADRAREMARAFEQKLPEIYTNTRMDAEAILAGDPAAESVDEVVAAYPGFLAIALYRIAHEIHSCGMPLLPRLLTEIAHGRTGIDIHPGAKIGRSFCIDHGTGIVIGETAIVGDDVKLYQGVTLGALSVTKDAAGVKRHPTVEDRVVIYANATVLGGATVVGHDSVVGGNVWLPNSVAPYSFVYQTSQVRIRSVSDALEPSDFTI